MSEEKNFLQSIKLEISRNFKLTPYERVSFHNILGLLHSDAGKVLLVRELDRGGDIATSALQVLTGFNDRSLVPVMIDQLNKNHNEKEIMLVLDFIQKNGGSEEVPVLIDFIDKKSTEPAGEKLVRKAFTVLETIAYSDSKAALYIESAINDIDNRAFLYAAVNALSFVKNTGIYENLLRRNDDELSYNVLLSIYKLNGNIFRDPESDNEYQHFPEMLVDTKMTEDEEFLLNIKVLLGKLTARFDDFSVKTKNAFINAMLSCNHREAVIYTMKALESRETELRRMVLFSVYSNITSLRFPEKLLRSLISMSSDNELDNELIVQIFNRYFNEKEESRSFILFRDKIFSYISATLESFFETYRREFMIPDVVENAFPENFRSVRNFILKKMNPEYKRKLLSGFDNEGKDLARRMIPVMSEWISYVDKSELEPLSALIDLMLDDDRVSRDNTVSRLDSVNFEKKYLQLRIIRLCKIIEILKIESAAKALVYIYNYLKKYPDPDIYESAIYALSRINYSYMLSEVEIMLSAGSPEEQEKAVTLLPLFTEKRLINILVDFLKNNFSSGASVVSGILNILVSQEIKSNINAAAVFKQIIENNPDDGIRYLAITGLGHCAFTEDIDYLHNLFINAKDQIIKETIVKAICSIMAVRNDYSRQQLSRQVQEYLKDPGIRVRIFSCMILIRLGNKDAFRSVREMLIIKNKYIQREILSVLRDIHTPDFNFFLLSLLREEYGISRDIIDIIRKFPVEELKEIESFIVNIFRKFDYPQTVIGVQQPKESNRFTGTEKKQISVLTIKIENFQQLSERLNYYELIELYLLSDLLIIPELKDSAGAISHKESSSITICYKDPSEAIIAAVDIRNRLKRYNDARIVEKNFNVSISIITDDFIIAGDEIANYAGLPEKEIRKIPVAGRVIYDSKTESLIRKKYYSLALPEMLFSDVVYNEAHYEYILPINFIEKATEILDAKEEEIDRQKELKAQIESQIKTISAGNRSTTSIAIASELDNIGIKLKEQFDEIERYINRRSTDRELNRNIKVMMTNAYNFYRIEISKLTIK